MNTRSSLVTCGLPYTNGPCHIGHLRTYVPADFYVRYLRMLGEEVIFICGSDNHGTPIVVSAEEAGTTPRALSEQYHKHFEESFSRMGVIFDHFGMTDDPTNHRRTQEIVSTLITRGYIYPAVVQQSYCPKCQRFLPDRYVEGICPYCGKPARGDECDQGCGRYLEPGEILDPSCMNCGTKAETREQEHYFFRLGEFRDFLTGYLSRVEGTSNARNYALGWVKEGLKDWCITRTLDWGVRFPGRDDLVVYVWVDAPIGYISFTEEWALKNGRDWQEWWTGESKVTHFIGGDIIYHHGIFWPALLEGAGLAPSRAIVASGMVKVEDHKFSKSRGYVVWTNDDYLDQGLPADYLRYYLLSYTSHTKELNFSWKVYGERINNELVNTLGNFVYRTLHLASRDFGGVPDFPVSGEVLMEIGKAIRTITDAVRSYEFKAAVDGIFTLAAFGNNYIQSNAPWKLARDDPMKEKEVIRNCLQVTKALALLIEPVMPESGQKLWSMLGYEDQVSMHQILEAEEVLPVRSLPAPTPLFQKIDPIKIAELDALLGKRVKDAQEKTKKQEHITIDDFSRMDIRVGTITSAEPVKGSKKLLLLRVDLGEGEPRQIVSGIAQFYKPSDLTGLQVCVIANLKPATIFGIESHGMILAAGDEASILIPQKTVPPGTKVR